MVLWRKNNAMSELFIIGAQIDALCRPAGVIRCVCMGGTTHIVLIEPRDLTDLVHVLDKG